jgi:anti-sigma factor RsiW
VIRRAHHHLTEERLFDSYMAERSGEPIDPPVAEHLTDCASCGARYTELATFMDTLRREGDAEADACFTPERLRVQQQHIARRIALLGRPARILSFPGRIVRRTIDASTGSSARWIAAAAAAGLFIGVALGASYPWAWQDLGVPSLVARGGSLVARGGGIARPARMTPVATRGTSPADVAADDAFLSDLEVALERPHTRELQAFEALTPHVREIRDQR